MGALNAPLLTKMYSVYYMHLKKLIFVRRFRTLGTKQFYKLHYFIHISEIRDL